MTAGIRSPYGKEKRTFQQQWVSHPSLLDLVIEVDEGYSDFTAIGKP